MKRAAPIDCTELRELYEGAGFGVRAIAARLGYSPPTISLWLRRCGVPTRSGRFAALAVPAELLRQLYLTEGLPLRVIAGRLGVSVGTVHNWRRGLGLPPRRGRGAGGPGKG